MTLGQDSVLDPRARIAHPALTPRCGAACSSFLHFRGCLRMFHK